MKYSVVLRFPFLLAVLIGCKHEKLLHQEPIFEKEITMKSVKYQDMNAQMPENFPDELIDYNYTDLQQIASNGTARHDQNLRVLSGNSFDEIVESVKRKYPDFENAAPEEYRKYFPELSDRELIEKRELLKAMTKYSTISIL
jgi:hypothetical protein